MVAANATKIELKSENLDTGGNALCRFEFLECLVRIAHEKYRNDNFTDGLERLLDECIFPKYKPSPWQEFRDEQFWKIEIADVFDANIRQL